MRYFTFSLSCKWQRVYALLLLFCSMISAHAADLVFSNVSPAQGTVLAGIEDEQQITFNTNMDDVYPSPDMWDYATLTEADTYTFNFPEGYFVVNGENWPAFTLTFTVKPATTGINTVETESKAAKQVYTLTGIKVNGKPQKGVYIVNGKKVVLK